MVRALCRLVTSLLVLTVSLFAPVASSSFGPVQTVDITALRAGMSTARIRDHLVALDAIARANGGNRAAGTPGYQASVEYVRERLTSGGYHVEVQPFRVPHFAETRPPRLSRGGRAYAPAAEVRTMTFSGTGDVTAAVQPVDLTLPPTAAPSSTSGCEPADFASFSRGAVALLQRGGCTFTQKVANASRAGATAVLIMNEGQPDRQDLLEGTLEAPGVAIPVLGLSYPAGTELSRTPDAPVRVVTDVVSDYQETFNVIADGVGGRSDRVVMLGAHLDSVPAGPGINDDGSGVAMMLELADQLARSPGFRPRNRVRFAFWGAEEPGILGSGHYVSRLDTVELADIAVYLNFDMLGSPNFVRYVYDGDGSSVGTAGPPGSASVERMLGESLATQGLSYEPAELDGRSDYAPFAAAGVPVGGLSSGAEKHKTLLDATRYGGTAGQPMDVCYHQACDTLDNVSPVVLEQLAGAAADVTMQLLSAAEPRDIR